MIALSMNDPMGFADRPCCYSNSVTDLREMFLKFHNLASMTRCGYFCQNVEPVSAIVLVFGKFSLL